jgi:hypothetical protein
MEQRSGVVVTHIRGGVADHQRATVTAIARQLASLTGWQFAGEFDPSARYGRRPYFVPSQTLLAAEARALRIRSRDDLFGGVVPSSVVASKAIVYPLVRRDAAHPPGWSHAFADRVCDAVLPGFTASRARTHTAPLAPAGTDPPQAWPRHRWSRSAVACSSRS